jgi:hypothetical protein
MLRVGLLIFTSSIVTCRLKYVLDKVRNVCLGNGVVIYLLNPDLKCVYYAV